MIQDPELSTAPNQQERKGSAHQADLSSADPYAVLGLKRRASLSEINVLISTWYASMPLKPIPKHSS